MSSKEGQKCHEAFFFLFDLSRQRLDQRCNLSLTHHLSITSGICTIGVVYRGVGAKPNQEFKYRRVPATRGPVKRGAAASVLRFSSGAHSFVNLLGAQVWLNLQFVIEVF